MIQAIGLGVMMFGGISLQQTALQYTLVANAAFLTTLYVPAVPLLIWLIYRAPFPAGFGWRWDYVLAVHGCYRARPACSANGAIFW